MPVATVWVSAIVTRGRRCDSVIGYNAHVFRKISHILIASL